MIIYLLECISDDITLYKIGSTKKSVENRIKNLQTGNPYLIKELNRFESQYGRKLEKTLHNLYNHKKIKGEWFDLDINDTLKFINTCNNIENNFNELKNNPFFNY